MVIGLLTDTAYKNEISENTGSALSAISDAEDEYEPGLVSKIR